MNEIKLYLITSFVIILWSAMCFGGGYLLSNARAIKQLEETHQQLAEQQYKYENIIKSTREELQQTRTQLSGIREQLYSTVGNNDKATAELRELIEQIQKQKLII